MKKIVVIEDDPDVLTLVKYNLEREGFNVATLSSGAGAIPFCRREAPDLIVLDIMLPDSDGIDICRKIRTTSELAETPVIFLTARASETDRIVGLEVGANDYVVKPFFVRELVARVRAQLRSLKPTSRLLRAGGLELDPESCRVRVKGVTLDLTATEFKLLEHLMTRPGVVFSRQQLLDSVWGHQRAVTERAVDVYILRLRQKIEQAGESCIRSVRGFGYSFDPQGPAGGPAEGSPSAGT
ncbi:MAG: response regulator transcription factor [Bryobacteraceae bacterium]